MSVYSVQFQKGISLIELHELYGTEEKCRRVLYEMRWPKGYVCPMCGNNKYCEIKKRNLYQCNLCRYQASLTSGTLFDSTKLPLRTWFLGMYLLTQSKNGISTMEMMRHLGVSYKAAWRMHHKLMEVMYEREEEKKLKGAIEMDDSYLGGERSGGKRGRGAPGKTPFIAAVSKNEEGHPIYMKLAKIKGFRKAEINRWTNDMLHRGCIVTTDGLSCFQGIDKAAFKHIVKKVGSHRQAALEPAFHWVNTILCNVKTALGGTYHLVLEKYAHRYLAQFQYRFNRRFDLASMVNRLAYISVHISPRPERILKLAEI